MQREISDDVNIRNSVTSFQSVGKSTAVDKTASNFDNTNQVGHLQCRHSMLHSRDI